MNAALHGGVLPLFGLCGFMVDCRPSFDSRVDGKARNLYVARHSSETAQRLLAISCCAGSNASRATVHGKPSVRTRAFPVAAVAPQRIPQCAAEAVYLIARRIAVETARMLGIGFERRTRAPGACSGADPPQAFRCCATDAANELVANGSGYVLRARSHGADDIVLLATGSKWHSGAVEAAEQLAARALSAGVVSGCLCFTSSGQDEKTIVRPATRQGPAPTIGC